MAYIPPHPRTPENGGDTIGRIDCLNPKDALKQYPCLTCLSVGELIQLLVVILADYTNSYTLPEETPQLLVDSACYNCLSDKQLLQVIVAAIAVLAYGQGQQSVEEIRDKIKCLLCSTPAQAKGAAARLICALVAQLGNA